MSRIKGSMSKTIAWGSGFGSGAKGEAGSVLMTIIGRRLSGPG